METANAYSRGCHFALPAMPRAAGKLERPLGRGAPTLGDAEGWVLGSGARRPGMRGGSGGAAPSLGARRARNFNYFLRGQGCPLSAELETPRAPTEPSPMAVTRPRVPPAPAWPPPDPGSVTKQNPAAPEERCTSPQPQHRVCTGQRDALPPPPQATSEPARGSCPPPGTQVLPRARSHGHWVAPAPCSRVLATTKASRRPPLLRHQRPNPPSPIPRAHSHSWSPQGTGGTGRSHPAQGLSQQTGRKGGYRQNSDKLRRIKQQLGKRRQGWAAPASGSDSALPGNPDMNLLIPTRLQRRDRQGFPPRSNRN